MTSTGIPQQLVLVTGLSGAGKSTALRALEDLGFETVDNLPLDLLPRLTADPADNNWWLAVGVDSRTRAFSPQALAEQVAQLRQARIDVTTLYLQADSDVLQQRFTETRRRHPLAQDRPVVDGIAAEQDLLKPVRDLADHVIDTSDMTAQALRQQISALFAGESQQLTISMISFAYRHGVPRQADLVFDCRFLANPHYNSALRPKTGKDAGVAAFIAKDPAAAPFLDKLQDLLALLLPLYEKERKSYLTVALGCTGGQHRSVYIAEQLAARLQTSGYLVTLQHRDATQPPTTGG